MPYPADGCGSRDPSSIGGMGSLLTIAATAIIVAALIVMFWALIRSKQGRLRPGNYFGGPGDNQLG